MAEEKGSGPARSERIDWRYTARRRREFLRVLADSYDTKAACVAGRLTWPQVCELRVRHPDFAARFDEVIAAGYDRLEAMLLRRAGLASGGGVDLALAQALLKQRRMGKADAGAGGKKAPLRPPREQLIQSILDKVAPLKAVRAGEGRRDAARGGGGPRMGEAAAGRRRPGGARAH